MAKEFKFWHDVKQNIENQTSAYFPSFKQGEVWMCVFGLNLGREQDGEGLKFSRPVLIFKIFNSEMFWGIPITTKQHTTINHYKFNLGGLDQFAILSQMRLLSAKRLQRRIVRISHEQFDGLYRSFIIILPTNEIPLAGEISEANAL